MFRLDDGDVNMPCRRRFSPMRGQHSDNTPDDSPLPRFPVDAGIEIPAIPALLRHGGRKD
jgi:hypothetical protein